MESDTDGFYRVVFPKGKFYDAARIEDDRIFGVDPAYEGDPVSEMLAEGAIFTRVYPIHLPDEMWEEIHQDALKTGRSDDEMVEHAVRNFFIYFRPAPEYRKVIRNED
jgi:hypothetical protein